MPGVLVVCRTGALCLEEPSICLDAPAGIPLHHPHKTLSAPMWKDRISARRELSRVENPGESLSSAGPRKADRQHNMELTLEHQSTNARLQTPGVFT